MDISQDIREIPVDVPGKGTVRVQGKWMNTAFTVVKIITPGVFLTLQEQRAVEQCAHERCSDQEFLT
jgi:hypothetical protein